MGEHPQIRWVHVHHYANAGCRQGQAHLVGCMDHREHGRKWLVLKPFYSKASTALPPEAEQAPPGHALK